MSPILNNELARPSERVSLDLRSGPSADEPRSVALLESLLESLADGVFALDRHQGVIYWSPSLQRLTGRDATAAAGKPALTVLGELAGKISTISDGTVTGLLAAAPVPIPVKVTVIQAYGAGGIRVGKVCAISDLREQWRQQNQSLRTRALANLGHSVACAVHQIRNPLGASLGFSDLLARDLAGTESAPLLGKIREGLGEIDRRIGEILSYARPKPLLYEKVNLSELITTVVESINARFPDAAPVEVSTPDGVTMDCDPAQIQQALENLLVNAVEAAGDEGRTKIVLQGADPTSQRETDRREIRLLIRNTGTLTEPNLLGDMFEAFESTKNGGTGLGLPLAKRIIQMHRGDIEAISAGGWTTFVLTLPPEVSEIDAEKTSPELDRKLLERIGKIKNRINTAA
jgi:two-component system, NtrC family, sensor histidine kinase AtoS